MFTIYGDTLGFSSVSPVKAKSFKRSQIYRKHALWAKTNEKSIYRFLRLLFFELCLILYNSSKNWTILCTKTTIYQKLIIGKLIFHSFQHIPYLLCKHDHFWIFLVEKHFIHLAIKKLLVGLRPLHTPPCLRPWTPHAFGLNPQSHWLASGSASQKS